MSESKAYGMDFFAGDDDDCGVPFEDFTTALNVWTWMRPCNRQTTVSEAAAQFGVTDHVIRTAVKGHPWMYLCGEDDDPAQFIDHDGE